MSGSGVTRAGFNGWCCSNCSNGIPFFSGDTESRATCWRLRLTNNPIIRALRNRKVVCFNNWFCSIHSLEQEIQVISRFYLGHNNNISSSLHILLVFAFSISSVCFRLYCWTRRKSNNPHTTLYPRPVAFRIRRLLCLPKSTHRFVGNNTFLCKTIPWQESIQNTIADNTFISGFYCIHEKTLCCRLDCWIYSSSGLL